MTEDPYIIQLNIRHYQEILKLNRHTDETRRRVIELLNDAQSRLPLASPGSSSVGTEGRS